MRQRTRKAATASDWSKSDTVDNIDLSIGLDELHTDEFSDSDISSDSTTDTNSELQLVAGTYKRWSSSAVECYVRKGQCDGCYYQHFFSDKPYGCKMKFAVEQLLETHGKPRPQKLARG